MDRGRRALTPARGRPRLPGARPMMAAPASPDGGSPMQVLVQVRGRSYRVDLPPGSRVERWGRKKAVVVPGPRPGDTSLVLWPAALLPAAREGLHGLSVAAEAAAG